MSPVLCLSTTVLLCHQDVSAWLGTCESADPLLLGGARLGVCPALVRLFDRISHGLGVNPSSLLMRSLYR